MFTVKIDKEFTPGLTFFILLFIWRTGTVYHICVKCKCNSWCNLDLCFISILDHSFAFVFKGIQVQLLFLSFHLEAWRLGKEGHRATLKMNSWQMNCTIGISYPNALANFLQTMYCTCWHQQLFLNDSWIEKKAKLIG